VQVEWFSVLGQEVRTFSVAAHTIPFSEFFDGLLGMDLLTLLQARIHIRRQVIEVVGVRKASS
jgi:hypothetical protein